MHCTIRYIDCTKTHWWHNFFVFVFVSLYLVIILVLFRLSRSLFNRLSIKSQWPLLHIFTWNLLHFISFGFKLFQHFYWLIWRTPAFLALCWEEKRMKKKTVRSHIWKWVDHMSCFCVCVLFLVACFSYAFINLFSIISL